MSRYRIQDASGRGPWRPGFSHQWIDPAKDDTLCPPMMHDFPQWTSQVAKAQREGLAHFGCCVEGIRGLHRWFTPSELHLLRMFGFRLVDAEPLTPIAVSPYQIIGASRWPLRMLPVLDWEIAA